MPARPAMGMREALRNPDHGARQRRAAQRCELGGEQPGPARSRGRDGRSAAAFGAVPSAAAVPAGWPMASSDEGDIRSAPWLSAVSGTRCSLARHRCCAPGLLGMARRQVTQPG